MWYELIGQDLVEDLLQAKRVLAILFKFVRGVKSIIFILALDLNNHFAHCPWLLWQLLHRGNPP